jgi:predicted lipoprotein with Yx(FWY)xxD motif
MIKKTFFVCLMLITASLVHARDIATIIDGVLTANKGMSLYTFDKDVIGSGKSECNDQCAKNWPPFNATEKDRKHAHGQFKTITREDGTLQWTTKSGKPLYFYSKDLKPGDKLGDNLNNVWKLAK